jgi:hypothetical protein
MRTTILAAAAFALIFAAAPSFAAPESDKGTQFHDQSGHQYGQCTHRGTDHQRCHF